MKSACKFGFFLFFFLGNIYLCWVWLKFLVTIKGLGERGGMGFFVKVFAIKVSVLLFVAVEILKRETVKKASVEISNFAVVLKWQLPSSIQVNWTYYIIMHKALFLTLKKFLFLLSLSPTKYWVMLCLLDFFNDWKKKITSNFEGLRWICMSILKSFMVKKWVLLFEKFSSWMIFLFLGNLMVEMLYFGFADLFLTFSLIHVTRSGP